MVDGTPGGRRRAVESAWGMFDIARAANAFTRDSIRRGEDRTPITTAITAEFISGIEQLLLALRNEDNMVSHCEQAELHFKSVVAEHLKLLAQSAKIRAYQVWNRWNRPFIYRLSVTTFNHCMREAVSCEREAMLICDSQNSSLEQLAEAERHLEQAYSHSMQAIDEVNASAIWYELTVPRIVASAIVIASAVLVAWITNAI